MTSHADELREILERMPVTKPPAPWSLIGEYSIGGLTEIGFVPESDDLLVVSSQGRGLFDTTSGDKIARDSDESFHNPDKTGHTVPAIGPADGQTVPLAGLMGGGLSKVTDDGWVIEVVQLPWPRHVLFLSSDFAPCYDDSGHAWKICDDEPCEYRMAGFSPSGNAFVFASSCELTIYGRSAV